MTLVERVVEELDTAGIASAIIGGVALASAGVARSTLDVDLLATDARVLDAPFWSDLAALGISVDVRVGDDDDPLRGLVRFEQLGQRPVDLVIGKPTWQQRAVERAVRLESGPAVVLPRDLVLLKLYAGGTQDLWDVRELLAASPDDTLVANVEADLADLPAWMQECWTSLRA